LKKKKKTESNDILLQRKAHKLNSLLPGKREGERFLPQQKSARPLKGRKEQQQKNPRSSVHPAPEKREDAKLHRGRRKRGAERNERMSGERKEATATQPFVGGTKTNTTILRKKPCGEEGSGGRGVLNFLEKAFWRSANSV